MTSARAAALLGGSSPELSLTSTVPEVSERVVWRGPQGTRLGTVRWVGELPDLRPGPTVGVELDYELPAGGTDGWYDGRFLFRARARHGQLVSPTELVSEDAFFGRRQEGSDGENEYGPGDAPPVLSARELIEDAMARVATEQRVLRARARQPPAPAVFGTPLTMLEPPWRVAAANAARAAQGNAGVAATLGRKYDGATITGRGRGRRMKSPSPATSTMPARGLASSPGRVPRKTGADHSPGRGIFSFMRLFRRRRSLSSERRVTAASSPPPQRPLRASSEDRQMVFRPRKRAAPAPPATQPGRPSRGGTAQRRGVTVTTDHVRHVRGKRKAPPPPPAGYSSLQAQRSSPPPAAELAGVRSLDRPGLKQAVDQRSRQNDTLVLEGGVLRPRRIPAASASPEAAEAPGVPAASRSVGTLGRLAAAAGPRLWYKRKKGDEPKPADQKERRGRKEKRGKHQTKDGAGSDGELDWLADMVYARQSVAPPDGTVERRLQVLRHLTDQEERSERPAYSPPQKLAAGQAQTSGSRLNNQREGVLSQTKPASLTQTEADTAKHKLKSPALVRQAYPQLPGQCAPVETSSADPQPPGQCTPGDASSANPQPPLPDKSRGPLRSLFARDRSPRDKHQSDTSAGARPRFSVLSNISALDAEAARLIEGRAAGSAGSGASVDPAATLPSNSQLGGPAKTHAQQEKEKQQTCQTIAMLVREKFVEGSGDVSGSGELKRESERVEERTAGDGCAGTGDRSRVNDALKEMMEKSSDLRVDSERAKTAGVTGNSVEVTNSANQDSSRPVCAAERRAVSRLQRCSYPTERNPFEDTPPSDCAVGTRAQGAASGHGQYDNVKVTDGTPANPFDGAEGDYPDDKNPFSDEGRRKPQSVAAAAADSPVPRVRKGQRSSCSVADRPAPALTPPSAERPARTPRLQQRSVSVEQAAGLQQQRPAEKSPTTPSPPARRGGTAPRGSGGRCGGESGQLEHRADTAEGAGQDPGQGNGTSQRHCQKNGDIPTLVRDLNQFLDTTIQTMSSPTAQRRRTATRTANAKQQEPDAGPAADADCGAAAAAGSGDWSCARCTLVNRSVLSTCQACGARRPDGAGVDWSVEVQRYFGADGKPKPTKRKESLGIVQGGVAHRAGEYPGTAGLARARSQGSGAGGATGRPSPMLRSGEHVDDMVDGGAVYRGAARSEDVTAESKAVSGKGKLAEMNGSVGGAEKKASVSTRKISATGMSDRSDGAPASSGLMSGQSAEESRGTGFQEDGARYSSAEVKKHANLPSTFVSQLLQKESATAVSHSAAPSASTDANCDVPDMDEVRRARLAFFAQRAHSCSTEQDPNPPLASGKDDRRRSSSESSSIESPTDADDADDESDSSDSPHQAHPPLRAEPRASSVTRSCEASAPSLPFPTSPTSASAPPLPAIKEGSPSDYLEEAVAGPPRPSPDHLYEDVDVSPRPWKLTPAEKARRRPLSGSLGRPQWSGDALLVPDGRGGRVRCVVERDRPAPQYVIRNGVLYSQLPTMAAVQSRAEPLPRDGGVQQRRVAPSEAASGHAGSKSSPVNAKTSSSDASQADPGGSQRLDSTSGATPTSSGPTSPESPRKDGTTVCNGFTSPPRDVSTDGQAASAGVPVSQLELDQGHSELMRQLQRAIDTEQHKEAAVLARKLAALKADKARLANTTILVNLHVEDRTCHVGPMPLQLSPLMTVHELKTQIERDYQLPGRYQRWIIAGAMLAPSEQQRSLAESGVTDGSDIHLYLVPPSGEAPSLTGAQMVSPKAFLRSASPAESLPSRTHGKERPHDTSGPTESPRVVHVPLQVNPSAAREDQTESRSGETSVASPRLTVSGQSDVTTRNHAWEGGGACAAASPSSESLSKLRFGEAAGFGVEDTSDYLPSAPCSQEV